MQYINTNSDKSPQQNPPPADCSVLNRTYGMTEELKQSVRDNVADGFSCSAINAAHDF